MKPGGSPQKVAVAIAADAKANSERVVPVTNGARELAVAPSGKEVAFIARGDVFVTSVEGGVTKRITTTPEEERGVGFSPDGKALVYASERGGRWADLRGPQDARRGAVLLRVHRREGNAARRERAAELPAAVLAGRQGARLHRGPQHAEGAQPRVEGSRARCSPTRRSSPAARRTTSSGAPTASGSCSTTSIPGIAPGEVGLVRADGKGDADEPHAERLQRRSGDVDPRRQGDAVVQQPRRPEVGGPERRRPSATSTRCSSRRRPGTASG